MLRAEESQPTPESSGDQSAKLPFDERLTRVVDKLIDRASNLDTENGKTTIGEALAKSKGTYPSESLDYVGLTVGAPRGGGKADRVTAVDQAGKSNNIYTVRKGSTIDGITTHIDAEGPQRRLAERRKKTSVEIVPSQDGTKVTGRKTGPIAFGLGNKNKVLSDDEIRGAAIRTVKSVHDKIMTEKIKQKQNPKGKRRLKLVVSN